MLLQPLAVAGRVRRDRRCRQPASAAAGADRVREAARNRDKLTLGNLLNALGERFGGSAPAKASASVAEAALAGAYALLRAAGGALLPQTPLSDAERLATSDANVLVAAARRASPSQLAAAKLAWGDDAGPELGSAAELAAGTAVLAAVDAADAARAARTLRALLGCSVTAASLCVARERRLLGAAGSRQALATRCVALRAATPKADLPRMTLGFPRLLAGPEAEMAAFSAAAEQLRAGLPGVDVCLLAQEDGELLLCDPRLLAAGLRELAGLWSREDLATMHSEHAALALRALAGLPRRGSRAKGG